MAVKVRDWHIYSGAVHIHTTASDGTKPLEGVVALGRSAGLDFMLFTDHMTLEARENGREGFYGPVAVLIGYEHNDPNDENHYLVFDVPRVYDGSLKAEEFVAQVARDSGIGIIAHPDEVRTALPEYPPYPWNAWQADGFTGIELWNQMSEWTEKLTRSNKLFMSLSPRKSIREPNRHTIRRWDELNKRRKVVGIASVDAHAFPIRVGPLTVEIFPYKVHFRSLRTSVILPEPLSEDFPTARRQIYDAIRDCRIYCSHIRWGQTDGFLFEGQAGAERVTCGGRLSSTTNARLHVVLPGRASIRLIHDGRGILETHANHLDYAVSQPGLYRVEAWKQDRGWIFSNHIRVAV